MTHHHTSSTPHTLCNPSKPDCPRSIAAYALFITCCFLVTIPAFSQSPTRPQSDNYIRGVEALNNGDVETAYSFLNQEIEMNPDNGYAHCYMALVCNCCGDCRLAMHAVGEALRLLPEEDREYRSFAYYSRGMMLLGAKAYSQAESDFTRAIDLLPEDTLNYMGRAEALMMEGRYEEAMADLVTVKKIDEKADVFELMMKLMELNPDSYDYLVEMF